MKIAIIVGTTRQQRVTPLLAKWVNNTVASKYPESEVKLLDLADYDIPLLEEAPWLPDRTLTEGAKRWLTDLAWADGYIITTAEYNHSIPAVLKNALDFTQGEMRRKPTLIVSHGAVHGARSDAHLRLVLNSAIGSVPVPNDVPFYGRVDEAIDNLGNITEDGKQNQPKLEAGLDELFWYANALNNAR
jgi:NAD(P)H-dependent FMN reductase